MVFATRQASFRLVKAKAKSINITFKLSSTIPPASSLMESISLVGSSGNNSNDFLKILFGLQRKALQFTFDKCLEREETISALSDQVLADTEHNVQIL